MKKRTLLWFFSFVLIFTLNLYFTLSYVNKVKKANAANSVLEEIESMSQYEDSASSDQYGYQTDIKLSDGRAVNLKSFFRKHNSPLYNHAEYIVKVADYYQFDYRLLPAIAMQESGLCRSIPKDSHNCWGWGIYGNTVTRFDSYEDAIDTVAKGIRKNYIDKGLNTASKIMEKYTPSSNGSWAYGVNTFMKALE